jgi:GNAT superfamily N-acetyltransferase
MNELIQLVKRAPTVDEYASLIAAVGWRARDRRAIELAMRSSMYAVCAEADNRVIGCGRVIGDGGLHFYLTDVIVVPKFRRQGIGTAIVSSLTQYVESLPFVNTLVAVLPTSGLASFYERHGYKPQGGDCPIMQRWINGN